VRVNVGAATRRLRTRFYTFPERFWSRWPGAEPAGGRPGGQHVSAPDPARAAAQPPEHGQHGRDGGAEEPGVDSQGPRTPSAPAASSEGPVQHWIGSRNTAEVARIRRVPGSWGVVIGRALPSQCVPGSGAGGDADARGQGRGVVGRQRAGQQRRIWAAGDVTGHPQFVYVAGAHGTLVADNAFDDAVRTVDYHHLPQVTFTTPAIASAGLTDAQAVEQGYL
jgi:hypothetical protein